MSTGSRSGSMPSSAGELLPSSRRSVRSTDSALSSSILSGFDPFGDTLIEIENIRRGEGNFDESMSPGRLVALGDIPLDDWETRDRLLQAGVLSSLSNLCGNENVSMMQRGLAARAVGNLTSEPKARRWVARNKVPLLGNLVALASSGPSKDIEPSDVFMIHMHCYFALGLLLQQDFGKRNRAAELKEMMVNALAESGSQFARAHKTVNFASEDSDQGSAFSEMLERSISTPQTPSSLFETMRRFSSSRPATPAELFLAASIQRPMSAAMLARASSPLGSSRQRPLSSTLSMGRGAMQLPPLKGRDGISLPMTPSSAQRPRTALQPIKEDLSESKKKVSALDLQTWGFSSSIPPPPSPGGSSRSISSRERASTALSAHLARPSTVETSENRMDTAEARTFYSILSSIATKSGVDALRGEFFGFLQTVAASQKERAAVAEKNKDSIKSPYAAPLSSPSKRKRAPKKRAKKQQPYASNRTVHRSRLYAAPLAQPLFTEYESASILVRVKDNNVPSPSASRTMHLFTPLLGMREAEKSMNSDEMASAQGLALNESIMEECTHLPQSVLEKLKGSGIAAQYAARILKNLERKVSNRYVRDAFQQLRGYAADCVRREYAAKKKRERILASLRLMQKLIRKANVNVQAKCFSKWVAACERQRRVEMHAAAIMVQCALRRRAGVKYAHEEMLRQIRDFLATQCQALYRGRKARHQYIVLRNATLKLQSWFRIRLEIKWFFEGVVRFIRCQHGAARTIQTWYGDLVRSRKFREAVEALLAQIMRARVLIQSSARRRMAIKRVEKMRMDRVRMVLPALRIQAWWRRRNGELSTHILMFCLGVIDEKERAEARRDAATLIQRQMRRRRGKWLWQRERLKQRVEKRCGKLILGSMYAFWQRKIAERRQRNNAARTIQVVWLRRSITMLLVYLKSGKIRHVHKESVLILRANKVFESYHPWISRYFLSAVDTRAFDRFISLPYWIVNPGSLPPPSRLVQRFRRERLRRSRMAAIMRFVRRRRAAVCIQAEWRRKQTRTAYKQLQYNIRAKRRAEAFDMLMEDRRSSKLRNHALREEAAKRLQRYWKTCMVKRRSIIRAAYVRVNELGGWISSQCTRVWFFKPAMEIQKNWRAKTARVQVAEERRVLDTLKWKGMKRQRYLVFAARVAQRYWRGIVGRRYAKRKRAGSDWIKSNPFYEPREEIVRVLHPNKGKLAKELASTFDPFFPETGMSIVVWLTRMGLRESAHLFLDAGFEFFDDLLADASMRYGKKGAVKMLFGIFSPDDRTSRAEATKLAEQTADAVLSRAWKTKRVTFQRAADRARRLREELGFEYVVNASDARKLFSEHFPHAAAAKADRFTNLIQPLLRDYSSASQNYAVTRAQLLAHLRMCSGKPNFASSQVQKLIPRESSVTLIDKLSIEGEYARWKSGSRTLEKLLEYALLVLSPAFLPVSHRELVEPIPFFGGYLAEILRKGQRASCSVRTAYSYRSGLTALWDLWRALEELQRAWRNTLLRRKMARERITESYLFEANSNRPEIVFFKELEDRRSAQIQKQLRKNRRNRLRIMCDTLEVVQQHGWKAVPDAASGETYYWNGKEMIWQQPLYNENDWHASVRIQGGCRGFLVRWRIKKRLEYVSKFVGWAIQRGAALREAHLANLSLAKIECEAAIVVQKYARRSLAYRLCERLRPKTPPPDPSMCSKCATKRAKRICVDCGNVPFCFLCFEASHINLRKIHTFLPIMPGNEKRRARRRNPHGCHECSSRLASRFCHTCSKRLCFACCVAPQRHLDMGHDVRMIETDGQSPQEKIIDEGNNVLLCCSCDDKGVSRICFSCIKEGSQHPHTGRMRGLYCDGCYREHHQCFSCSSNAAAFYCNDCEKKYCVNCCSKAHQFKSSRSHDIRLFAHSWISMNAEKDVAYIQQGDDKKEVGAAPLELCSHCPRKRPATEYCQDCEDAFCVFCFARTHEKGKRATHICCTATTVPGLPPRPLIVHSDKKNQWLPSQHGGESKTLEHNKNYFAFGAFSVPVLVLLQPAFTGFADIESIEIFARKVGDEEKQNIPEVADRCSASASGYDPADLDYAREYLRTQKQELLGARKTLMALTRQIEIARTHHEKKWRLDCEARASAQREAIALITSNIETATKTVAFLELHGFKHVDTVSMTLRMYLWSLDGRKDGLGGKTMQFRILAVNRCGRGPLSPVVEHTFDADDGAMVAESELARRAGGCAVCRRKASFKCTKCGLFYCEEKCFGKMHEKGSRKKHKCEAITDL